MFAEAPVIQLLSDTRIHLSHGPIDIVLKAWGPGDTVTTAYRAAVTGFGDILPELCGELSILRAPVGMAPPPEGFVARRMVAACWPFADRFVTPMAAVAGAVADTLMDRMRTSADINRAYVNNGGDIAVFCGPGQSLDIAVMGNFDQGPIPARNGSIRLSAGDGIGGVATSGRHGRSLSMGIADSVTVLAADAALADAAATLIANAVDVDDPRIDRAPASTLDPDSDLGDRLVTVSVDRLGRDTVRAALDSGVAEAERLRARGLIVAAALRLQGADAIVCGQRIRQVEGVLRP